MSVTKTTGAEHYIIHKNHEWASIVVRCWDVQEPDGKTRHCGEILIHSSYGSWANSWGHCGNPFKQFLQRLDFDYLFTKFMGNKLCVFDGEGSVKRLRERLLEARREGTIDKAAARQGWEEIEEAEPELESSEREFVDAVYRIVGYVDNALFQRVFDEPWGMTAKRPDDQAMGFWRELWPEFMGAIKAEAVATEGAPA